MASLFFSEVDEHGRREQVNNGCVNSSETSIDVVTLNYTGKSTDLQEHQELALIRSLTP